MWDSVGLAVIGTGRIGRIHAGNAVRHLNHARLAAVADVHLEAASACAAGLGVADAYADYRSVLDRTDVDAVIVSSSTDTHAEIVSAAASAGKHVFCEKPISLDLETIDSVLRAVETSGVKLQIGFNRRFDADYRRVREAVRSGEIGEPHLLHLISRDPEPPPIEYVRKSGGLFLDMTIHDFDMARFLIGEEVEEIWAAAAVRIDPAIGEAGDVDTAVLTLKFSGGVLGTIDNSRAAVYGYDQRAEVFGSKGRIQTFNRHASTALVSDGGGVRRDLPLRFFIDRYAESYVQELRAFVSAVRDDAPVPVGGADGRIPVVLGLAAKKSLRENRPVRVEEIG